MLANGRHPKRERLGIISAVLSIVGDGETAKTNLMYRSNLDYKELKKYMALMTEKGLLSSRKDDDRHDSYHLTEKGRDFLQLYEELEQFLA